jgi:hypothetical protein
VIVAAPDDKPAQPLHPFIFNCRRRVGSVFETDSYQDGKVADVFLIRHSPTRTSSKSIFDFGNFVRVRAPLYDYFRTSPPSATFALKAARSMCF